MKIKSVTIKNIRGFQNRTIELDMIPNKPSMIIAPNGTGKSSFAIAFKSLKAKSLQVDKEEIYSNNDTYVPELSVETDVRSYVADSTKNELNDDFAIYVINNQNKAKIITNKIAGTRVATSKMHVAPIVLIKNFTLDVSLNNSFIAHYNLQNLVRGLIPSIDNLIKNKFFLAGLDVSMIKDLKRDNAKIDSFIGRLKNYAGRKIDIWDKIRKEDIPLLSSIDMVKGTVDYIKSFDNSEDDVLVYLKAIQVIKFYLNNKSLVNQRIKHKKYVLERDAYKELFSSLKSTWKNVEPKEVDRNLIIEIPDTDKLSNGERDIIVFLAMLQQAKNSLTKSNNILIIDEIFDYLDDANLIAAQYYIVQFVEEIKNKGGNIFPIILSHLNPNYFKSYAFKDLKVYYLNPHRPLYSVKMEKLLYRRSELMEADKKNNTETDLISKYMLHFHYDYSVDMGSTLGNKAELVSWKNVNNFKKYCKDETDKYLKGENYDSVAICVWLRECIEKFMYDKLLEDKKELFIKERGTKKKIQFAEENGIDCPETFCMLGLIYNDNLHIENKSKEDSREILYSRLENNTIREMIRAVVK